MLTWAETKNLLADKLRYHAESTISPGTAAVDIEFGTAFVIRARLYYDMWCQDVYAIPVDKGVFTCMNLASRLQNLMVHNAEKVFHANTIWIDSQLIRRYPSYADLKGAFDAVNVAAGKPAWWAQVRPGIIAFHCTPDQFYADPYAQGFGFQPIGGDEVIVEIPANTIDTFCEYAAAHFMMGVTQSEPGLNTLKMFNANAYVGARAIRATNYGYDFTGARRGG